MDSLMMSQDVLTLFSAKMVLELGKDAQVTSILIQMETSVISQEISIQNALTH